MRRNNGGVFIWQVFPLPSSVHSHHSCISLLHFFVEIFQEAVSHIRRVCVVPALWYKPVIFDISSKLPCVRALCVTYAALTRFNIKEHFSIFNNYQRPHRAGILFMCCSFFCMNFDFQWDSQYPFFKLVKGTLCFPTRQYIHFALEKKIVGICN